MQARVMNEGRVGSGEMVVVVGCKKELGRVNK